MSFIHHDLAEKTDDTVREKIAFVWEGEARTYILSLDYLIRVPGKWLHNDLLRGQTHLSNGMIH